MRTEERRGEVVIKSGRFPLEEKKKKETVSALTNPHSIISYNGVVVVGRGVPEFDFSICISLTSAVRTRGGTGQV